MNIRRTYSVTMWSLDFSEFSESDLIVLWLVDFSGHGPARFLPLNDEYV